MSPEQRAAVESISQELEGKSRNTFIALANAYPKAFSQKKLVEHLREGDSQSSEACGRIGVRIKAIRERLAASTLVKKANA